MKHSLSRVLALVVTLSISMGSSAMYTGSDLLNWCDEDNEYIFALCSAYIQGAEEGHRLTSMLNKQDSFYCIPEKATHGQTAKVVSKYLKNHPEKLHETAIGLVYLALNGAFPCEDGQ